MPAIRFGSVSLNPLVRHSDRFEPEFHELVVPLHVNVNRFISVAGEKEKPVRAALQDSRTHLIGFCQVFELAPTFVSGSLQFS